MSNNSSSAEQGYKHRFYVSVEVDSEDQAKRLRKTLKNELPGLEVFAEVSKTRTDTGEEDDCWEIQ